MRNRRIVWCLAAASLLFASCAALSPAPLEDTMRSLDAAKTCCSSPKEFAYEPLPPLESRWFDITSESAAFEFPTGKSYFKAFELPAYRNNLRLDCKAYADFKRQRGNRHLRPGAVSRRERLLGPQLCREPGRQCACGKRRRLRHGRRPGAGRRRGAVQPEAHGKRARRDA